MSSFDIRNVVTNIPVVASLAAAVAGWFVAFIGLILFESKFQSAADSGSGGGVAWFGIFFQLATIAFAVFVIATQQWQHRVQCAIFIAISLVFSILGTDRGIYGGVEGQTAMGAGFLILSIVNIFWLVLFSSDESSFLASLLGSHSYVGRRTVPRHQNHGNGVGNTYATPIGNQGPYGNMTTTMTKAPSIQSASAHSNHMPGSGSPTHANNTVTSNGASAVILPGSTPAPQDPNMVGTTNTQASAAPGQGALMGQESNDQSYTCRAKALYTYTASPDDPNELGFSKGEILNIIDNTGKWWQARKSDGATGIVPSNYLTIL